MPLIALLDGAEEREYLRQLDWKYPPDETVWAIDDLIEKRLDQSQPGRWDWAEHYTYGEDSGFLQEIAEKFPEWSWVSEKNWWHYYTEDLLKEIGFHIQERNLRLAHFDIDSDSYPLVVVKNRDLQDLQNLSSKTGYANLLVLERDKD